MDEQLIEAIEKGTVGIAVFYGEGEREDFFYADGWTDEQIINFSLSVDGLTVRIVGIHHL